MAAEIVSPVTDDLPLSSRGSSNQLWRHETGFLEMFLAYFCQYGQSLSAAKSYRDFLYEVLCIHEKYASQVLKIEQNNEAKALDVPETNIVIPKVDFDEEMVLVGEGCEVQPSADSLPDEALSSFAGAKEENSVPNASCPSAQMPGPGPPDPACPLPCLICLQWFPPEQRLSHNCVPSAVRLDTQLTPPPPPQACALSPQALPRPQKKQLLVSEASQSRKRFKCRHCDKSFDSTYKLNRHGRIHSGERPFACAHCPKRFSRKEHRSRHLQQVHLETPPVPCFTCDFCERDFKTSQAKMFHERTHAARSEFEADEPVS